MKRLLAVFLLLLVLVPQMVSAGADYSQVGTITAFTCVQVVDKPDYYRIYFTVQTKITESFAAYCPVLIAPMDVMFVEPQSKYSIKMNLVDGEWYIQSFNLINELNKTVKPPIKMASYSPPKAIYYNRDAVGDEWMVRVEFGSINTAPFEISAKAVQKLTGETTIDQISARVSSLSQKLFEDWVRVGTPPDDLSYTQRVEVVNNQNYLVDSQIYFGFHIYSLDDPLTPDNELSFTTIFSIYKLPDIWW